MNASDRPPSRPACEEVRLELPRRLTEEVDADERRLLDEHLESCAACAREWRDLQELQRRFEADLGPTSAQVAEARLALRRGLGPAIPRHDRGLVGRLRHPLVRRAAGCLLAVASLLPLAWITDAGALEGLPRREVDGLASQLLEEVRSLRLWLTESPVRSGDLLRLLPSVDSGLLWSVDRSG